MYVYIYIYICIYIIISTNMCVYIYIYIYILTSSIMLRAPRDQKSWPTKEVIVDARLSTPLML